MERKCIYFSMYVYLICMYIFLYINIFYIKITKFSLHIMILFLNKNILHI